jgi:predicted RNA-binding Zn-ribbon protein involved in translation (DUF1610 family)
MLKFRCQHCGQRIAVPARHLGKLVTCAECGEPTHPLAEQIVKAKKASAPAPAPTPAVDSVACDNCAQTIGRLQQSHRWNGRRVCQSCYHLLSGESSGPPAARAVATVVERMPHHDPIRPAPVPPPGLRERVLRSLMVFVVAVVALYGALTLLRDIAGLIAVTALGILALVAVYAVFRARWAGRIRPSSEPPDAALVALRR